jgi:hypothetical protein
MHKPLVMLALGLALAGCQAPGGASLTTSPTALRALSVLVNAPTSLAGGAGAIRSEAVSNVIAAGGGNVIAAGGGNVIAAGGGNYRVRAAAAAYAPVTDAFVYVEDTLTGKAVGAGVTTDATGRIALAGVPDDGRALSAVARFKLNGKDYRMAVAIAPGPASGPVVADPINTVVEGRIRQILRAKGKASALAFAQLSAVWTVFNDADVNVDLAALDNATSLDDVVGFYQGLLDQLAGHDPDGAKAKVVKDYMATLQGS